MLSNYYYKLIVLLCFTAKLLIAQNPATITFPSPTPNPANLSVDSYTRAITKINLQNNFKYGFVTGGATNLLNLSLGTAPTFVSSSYNQSNNPSGNCVLLSDNTKVVGETPGNVSVSNTGGAIYSVPIYSPPGTKDISPKLAVYYNSQSGYGELGYGFHLSGLSSINRLGKIPVDDGTYSGIELSLNDYFALDGNKLMLNVGTYGGIGSTYYTQVESYSKITAFSQAGNGPAYFVVKDKLGNTVEYGNTPDAKLIGIGDNTILAWFINKVTDEFGNYMTYHYKLLNGETVIDKIEYTGNGAIQPYNYVELTYIPLAEKSSYYINGKEFKKTQLLKSITSYAENQFAHKYVFNYNWQNNRTELTSLQEIDSKGNELNPTTICWDDLSDFAGYKNNQNAQLFSNAAEYTNLKAVVPADIDGDGFTDFICHYNNSSNSFLSVKVLRNNLGANYGSSNFTIPFNKIYDNDQNYYQSVSGAVNPIILASNVIDDNYDNIQDVYLISKPEASTNKYRVDKVTTNSGYSSTLSQEAVYTNLANNINPNFTPTQFIYDKGDYTGDGINDVLRIDPENIFITSSQGNLSFPLLGNLAFSLITYSTIVRPIEFDGDGIPEFITFQLSPNIIATTIHYKVFKIDKTSGVALTLINSGIITFPHSNGKNLLNHLSLGDHNGDGKTDIAILGEGADKLYIMYCNGQNYLPKKLITYTVPIIDGSGITYNVVSRDLNSDGKADIIITNNQNNSTNGIVNYVTYYFLGDIVVPGPSYNGNFTFTKQTYDVLVAHGKGSNSYYTVEQQTKDVYSGYQLKADYNGDGVYDVISINSPSTDKVITNNATGYSNNAVRVIHTGLEKNLYVGYGNINTEIGGNKEEIYRDAAESYIYGDPPLTTFAAPLYKFKPNLYCVQTLKSITGGNQQIENSTRYIYENAILHLKGRGFSGFENIYSFDYIGSGGSVTGTLLGSKKTTSFNNSKNLPLNTRNITVKFVTGTSLKKGVPTYYINTNFTANKTDNVYSIHSINPNSYYVTLDQATNIDYLHSANSKSTYNYDLINAGNILNTQTTSEPWSGGAPILSETNNYAYILNNGTYKLDIQTTLRTQQGEPSYTRETKYNYDGQGHITSIVNDPSFGTNALTTSFSQFTPFGDPEITTISAGDVPARTITSQYESKGRFIIKTTNNQLTDMEEFAYEPIYGNVIQQKGITGLITNMEYDGLGRLIKTTSPNGAINTVTYGWGTPSGYPYSSFNLGVYTILKQNEAEPYVKEYYASNELLRTETQNFNGTVIVDHKYNINGNVVNLRAGTLLETTEPHFVGQAKFLVTKFEYEPNFFRNSAEKVYLKNGSAYTYQNIFSQTTYNNLSNSTYYPKTITALDQTGKTITKVFNTAGQNTQTKNNGATQQIATNYYSSNGGLKQIDLTNNVNSQIITTTFGYNNLGQQTYVNDPSVGIITYAYNTVGELLHRYEPTCTFDYAYDAVGRVTSKTGSNVGATYYQYVTANAGKNLLDKVIGPSVTTEFKYDNLSRLIETKETIGTKVFKTNYTLDNYGRITEHIYPNGFKTKYNYSLATNELYLITDDNNTTIWQLTNKDAVGVITGFTYGNGNTTNIIRNDLHYLTQKTYGNNDYKQEYDFNPLTGNLNWRKFTSGFNTPLLENFTYDAGDRLTQVKQKDPYSLAQIQVNNSAFDPIGNITHKDDAGDYKYNLPAKPYQLTNIDNPTNNISLNTLNVTYNDYKKVSQISEMGTNKQMNFTYGNDEERIKMDYTINGINQYTRYYADDYDREETSSGGYREWNYIYAPTGLCAFNYKTNTSAQQLFYAVTDHLDNPLYIRGTQGIGLIEEYAFDAWGRRRNPTDWSYTLPSWNVDPSGMPVLPRGFTLHEMVDEFTLINMNGRVYDPVIGRFIQPDNYIQAPDNLQNFNRYAYVLNNPLKYNDPSGNFIAPLIAFMAVGIYTHFFTDMAPSESFVIGASVAAGVAAGPLVLGTGIPFANTASAILGSMAGSSVANIASGGQSGFQVSFGAASYDFVNNQLGYLGNPSNSVLENVGYAIGATANIQDALAGLNGTDVDVLARKRLWGHSEARDVNDAKKFVSVGPPDETWNGNIKGYKNELKYFKQQLQGNPAEGINSLHIDTKTDSYFSARIYNVNKNQFAKYSDRLTDSKALLGDKSLTYGFNHGCVNYTSRALFLSGVININAILPLTSPVLLNAELVLRQLMIIQSPYVYSKL